MAEHALDAQHDPLYCVYWIHLLKQTDPFVSGYVGVARDIEKRWRRHKRHANVNESRRNSYPLYIAFRHHGLESFVFDLLASDLDKSSAYNLEYALRPHSQIGYNIEPGGFWRSCLRCSSLTPLREMEPTMQRIAAHRSKVIADKTLPSIERIRRSP
jgi:predicted GIY-YIG superfamily endonuclease